MQYLYFNQRVNTPLGEGIVQSPFMVIDGPVKFLVRLPVNEQTNPHLKDSNCVTPRAEKSGLWVFSREELFGAHWVGGEHASAD
jgi:hypothetical protein